MTFQDLQYHLEGYGCTVDPFGDAYWAANCISGDVCIIEDLPEYFEVTICHYCDELSVPAPPQYRAAMEAYRSIREHAESISDPEPGE